MKHIFTISLCFLALSLSAQETITYPYNPDGDADGLVAVPDLQDILAVYGNPFSPAEIMVGDTALSEWIQILYQALQDQQAVIEAMQGAGGCNYYFPDGLDGQAISIDVHINQPYNVPIGKRLYLLAWKNSSPIISGLLNPIWAPTHKPLIINSGESVLSTADTLYTEPSVMNGILVNANTNIQPVSMNVSSTSPYTVPLGKRLYLLSWYPDNPFISGTGSDIGIPNGNPLVLDGGESLYSTRNIDNPSTFNGYLVDEDYFADCGGGGSSEEEESGQLPYIEIEWSQEGPDTLLIPASAQLVYLKSGPYNGSGEQMQRVAILPAVPLFNELTIIGLTNWDFHERCDWNILGNYQRFNDGQGQESTTFVGTVRGGYPLDWENNDQKVSKFFFDPLINIWRAYHN